MTQLTADPWGTGPLPTTPWGGEPCSVATHRLSAKSLLSPSAVSRRKEHLKGWGCHEMLPPSTGGSIPPAACGPG